MKALFIISFLFISLGVMSKNYDDSIQEYSHKRLRFWYICDSCKIKNKNMSKRYSDSVLACEHAIEAFGKLLAEADRIRHKKN